MYLEKLKAWVTGKVITMSNDMPKIIYEGWNFNSGNYLFTTDTK